MISLNLNCFSKSSLSSHYSSICFCFQWKVFLEANHVLNLLPSRLDKKMLRLEQMEPLKTWCAQILGPLESNKTWHSMSDPFDSVAFQLALAETWGGDYDMNTRMVHQQPVVTLEQLAFVLHAVGKSTNLVFHMHMTIF